MLDRRHLMLFATGAALAPEAVLAAAPAQIRLNALGAEDAANATRVGSWDVMETLWPAPGAEPVVTTGLRAERRMIGTILQEMIHDRDDAGEIRRIDYLKYDRVAGCWDYVSLETRIAVGIMPAWSDGPGTRDRIDLTFHPFAVAGTGEEPSGRMLRMRQTIERRDADRDRKDQFFAFADGTGRSWLAHRYDYLRRT